MESSCSRDRRRLLSVVSIKYRFPSFIPRDEGRKHAGATVHLRVCVMSAEIVSNDARAYELKLRNELCFISFPPLASRFLLLCVLGKVPSRNDLDLLLVLKLLAEQ